MFDSLQDWIIAVEVLLAGAISVSLLIKGEQPEKFLKKVLSFIEKFSKK